MKRKNRPRHGAMPQSHVALAPRRARQVRLERAIDAMAQEAALTLERQLFAPPPRRGPAPYFIGLSCYTLDYDPTRTRC